MIVGILGKAGSGKDTVSDILVKNHNFCKIAFADPIKRFLMDTFDFSEEQLWGPSEKRSEPDQRYRRIPLETGSLSLPQIVSKEIQDFEDQRCFGGDGPYLTPRFALQQVGTQGARTCYEDVWIDYALRKVKLLLSNKIYRYHPPKGVYSVLGDIEMDGSKHPSGVIISDCRFLNEVRKLKHSGNAKIIKVVRDGSGLKGDAAQHQSETEQDSIPDSYFDFIIDNNSSLKDLENNVEDIISKII